MERIDLVYILGKWSKWADNEIRYSIRSVEKYFAFKDIFIVGEKPAWLDATLIHAADASTNKIANATAKYLTAALSEAVGDRFALMNDDFFFTRPVENIPAWSRGTMAEMIKRHPTQAGYYHQSLCDTRTKLIAMGVKDPIDYEVHAPMVFEKKALIETMKMVGNEKPYAMRSCYGNLMGCDPVTVTDFKAQDLAEFAWQLKEDRELLSISDKLVDAPEFREWIERRYPHAGDRELDKGAGVRSKPGRAQCARRYFAIVAFTYGTKAFNRGDVIDDMTMIAIKDNPRLNALWELV